MKKEAEIIVALDVPDRDHMLATLSRMPSEVSWYKVGLELFCAEGPTILDPLREAGKSIFLDLKFHDIPRTVGHAVKRAAAAGVKLMTVHAAGGRAMLEEAAAAAASCSSPPKLVAVTTLTSLNEDDFVDLGIKRSLSDQALSLSKMAMEAGLDGMVTSAHEAQALRTHFPDALLVTRYSYALGGGRRSKTGGDPLVCFASGRNASGDWATDCPGRKSSRSYEKCVKICKEWRSRYKPNVLIVTGYGVNCEAESMYAWQRAGAAPKWFTLMTCSLSQLSSLRMML